MKNKKNSKLILKIIKNINYLKLNNKLINQINFFNQIVNNLKILNM